jgi:hypothetical protein
LAKEGLGWFGIIRPSMDELFKVLLKIIEPVEGADRAEFRLAVEHAQAEFNEMRRMVTELGLRATAARNRIVDLEREVSRLKSARS